ncbi:hypothetical protein [Lentibacillus sp. CBA3610]|uniref:hypothetical protein n=1 Tax=Lentibacillus sp. CBA3610 TaxID=2518176 RepID=UPI001595F32A|nr:hypothetical protein [Lentibacillus sp. CBA3610]QKY70706.1 hypothetical protein Len3610_14870 [Lentibacillus sp. CBA3610]
MILWETFDQNEIYILVALVIVYTVFFILPKKIPRHITLLFLVWGFATATFFDFTLGGKVMDLYSVNDSGQYELSDLLTYFLFAPFSYFFVYFYHYFQVGRKSIIFYIAGWTILGILMEQLSRFMEMTHYGDGYSVYFSVVIFLGVQTTTALYYELILRQQRKIGDERS